MVKGKFSRYQAYGNPHNPKQKYKKISINTKAVRACEIGGQMKNKNCSQLAYRKIFCSLGYRWACDNCAKLLCDNNSVKLEG